MICPVCQSDGQGEPIPNTDRFYGRHIGIEYGYGHPERYDGVSEWRCADCGARWGRWSGKVLKEGESERRAAAYQGRGLR